MPKNLKKFSAAELAEANGQAGKPIYIAHQGKVYDVSDSPLWAGGEHMGSHQAGQDLTAELPEAPHDTEVLARYPQVGIIQESGSPPAAEAGCEPEPSAARQFCERLFRRLPLLRRHPHPMVVHFPIVFFIATTGFTVLYLLTGLRSFEVTGFHCLAGGVLFTPVAMGTGLLTWWINYQSRMLRPVVIKLILSPLLLALGAGAWIWRWLDPEVLAHPGAWAYLALIAALTPLVSVVGWYGATLTFPLHED